jgi:hypothetical protein
VFEPVSSTPPTSNNAVVIVLSATGGTTDPSPGTYTYTPDETIKLTATPDSGFDFYSGSLQEPNQVMMLFYWTVHWILIAKQATRTRISQCSLQLVAPPHPVEAYQPNTFML